MTLKSFEKIFSFVRSMKFGITMLVLIMLLSIVGSAIPQGQDEHFYGSMYPEFAFKLIMGLKLDNIYNSALFGILFLLLIINLSMCSIFRLGRIIKKLKSKPSLNSMGIISEDDINLNDTYDNKAEQIFKKNGFSKYTKDTKLDIYYSSKNKVGFFGSWLLHFGILLVIVFYFYGNMTFFSEGVYGVPGTVQPLIGTDYKVGINDFKVDYNDDGSVKQYTSHIEVLDKAGNMLMNSSTSVNNPMRFKGYTFYQTSYGWAANLDVFKNGSSIYHETIYEKTIFNAPEENIAIYFNNFYPDFAATKNGLVSLSQQLNNPVTLYSFYYMGDVVKMNVTDMDKAVRWNEYEFVFHDPQHYTYVEVNKMNGQIGAMIGAWLILMGLLIVFYFKPVTMAIQADKNKIYVYRSVTSMKINKENYTKEEDIC